MGSLSLFFFFFIWLLFQLHHQDLEIADTVRNRGQTQEESDDQTGFKLIIILMRLMETWIQFEYYFSLSVISVSVIVTIIIIDRNNGQGN